MTTTTTGAHANPPSDIGGDGLFLRKSSGLVRELGTRSTLGINAGIMCMISSVTSFAVFQVAFQNSDYYLAIAVGAFFSLLLCLAYAQLVATFSRAGGEYVYASRVFTPVFGAMIGGAVLVAVTLNCANTVIAMGQIVFPFFFTTLGGALSIHGLVTFGSSTLIGKTPYVIVGLVVVAVFIALGTRSVHALARYIFWSFIAGVVAFALVVLLLLFKSHAGFVHDFNKTSGGADAYGRIASEARKGGFQPGATLSQAILAIPVGFLWFGGFTFANYAAGEIKRPVRTYKLAVLGALAIGTVGAFGLWFALRHAVGLHFLQASAALTATNPKEYSALTSLPQIQGGLAYSLVSAGDPVTKIVIATGTVLGFFANGLAYFFLASRVVFALSFDRLLPSKMADVHEKTRSPLYAVALVTFGVLAFTVLGDETSLLSVLHNLLLIVTAIFVVGSLAAAVLPYRRRELYEASPKAFHTEVGGVPLVTLLGVASAMACLFMVIELATHTAYSGGYTTSSVITLIVVGTLGGALYAVSKWNLGRRGIDLGMAMRELPPE